MQRFETLPRDAYVRDALAMRVHDPLWLLARQWQLGEFRGENAVSPVFADVRAESHVLDSWRTAADDSWRPYDPRTQPLEELVEAEPPPAADHELRVDAGLRWRALLSAAGAGGDLGCLRGPLRFHGGQGPAVHPPGRPRTRPDRRRGPADTPARQAEQPRGVRRPRRARPDRGRPRPARRSGRGMARLVAAARLRGHPGGRRGLLDEHHLE
jgi:hypothetical protein